MLAEQNFTWQLDQRLSMSLRTEGATLVAEVDGNRIFEYTDTDRPLLSGSIALVCEEGRADFGNVSVKGECQELVGILTYRR